MVSKNILSQYSDLKKEAEDIRLRIDRTEKQLRRMEEEGEVRDTVKGGCGGIQHFEIEGFPYPAYSQKKTRLYAYKAILESTELELNDKVKEVEEFINTIDDSRMRRIIRYKFIDGLTWEQVTAKMGSPNTVGSIKMAFQRFFEKIG